MKKNCQPFKKINVDYINEKRPFPVKKEACHTLLGVKIL